MPAQPAQLLSSTSAATACAPADLRLPRNWPAAFKENAVLKRFLQTSLKGKKVRLTATPSADVMKEAAQVVLDADDEANARRVHAALGWPVMRGFAVYESKEQHDLFVACERHWNLHPSTVWCDLTPRDEAHAEMVLVEADTAAAYARAPEVQLGTKARASAPEPIASAPEPAAEPPPPAEAACQPAAATEAPSLGFDDAMAMLSPGPSALAAASGRKVRSPAPSEDDELEEFVAREGVRPIFVGEAPTSTMKKVAWPGKNASCKLRVDQRAQTFELEARCWGTSTWAGGDGDKDEEDEKERSALLSEIYGGDVEWFSPPDSNDAQAALLTCSGHMLNDKFVVERVAEKRNGERRPPFTRDDIYSVCGPSLANPIEGSFNKSGAALQLKMDRRVDWYVHFGINHDY